MAPHAIYVEMQTYAIKLFQSNKKSLVARRKPNFSIATLSAFEETISSHDVLVYTR